MSTRRLRFSSSGFLSGPGLKAIIDETDKTGHELDTLITKAKAHYARDLFQEIRATLVTYKHQYYIRRRNHTSMLKIFIDKYFPEKLGLI